VDMSVYMNKASIDPVFKRQEPKLCVQTHRRYKYMQGRYIN